MLPLLLALAVAASDPGVAWCRADYDALVARVAIDYAGYPEKVEAAGADSLAALTAHLAAEAERAADPVACERVVRDWLGYFSDNHLYSYRTAQFDEGYTLLPEPLRPAQGPRTPSLTFPGAGTAVLRLPSMNLRYRAAVDSLFAVHHNSLTARPLLVVDVTGNGGGGDATYAAVAALIDSGPYQEPATEYRLSPGTLAYWRWVSTWDTYTDSERAEVLRFVDTLAAAPGAYYVERGRTVTPDTVYRWPARVAIIADGGTASSGETFLLCARQSTRTVIFGQPTMGAVDYGNIRGAALPSGRLGVSVPSNRYRWPGGLLYDATGVPPDVPIPDEHMATPESRLAFVLRVMGASQE